MRSPAAFASPVSPPDSILLGALLIMGSEFLFASMGATIRFLSADLSSEVIVFFRNAFGLFFLRPWLLRDPNKLLGTGFPLGHLLRSCAGLAAMYCFFYAIAHMLLAERCCSNSARRAERVAVPPLRHPRHGGSPCGHPH